VDIQDWEVKFPLRTQRGRMSVCELRLAHFPLSRSSLCDLTTVNHTDIIHIL
jgi:hypothetical protein